MLRSWGSRSTVPVPNDQPTADEGQPAPETVSRLPGESRKAMQKRLKRPAHRPRNPMLEFRFKPTVEHRALVKLLAGYMIPYDRITKAIYNPLTRRPIGVTTLLKHFEHELEAGRAEVDSLIAEGLTKKLREGHMTALIWCSKNLWSWCDRIEQQGTNTVDVTVKYKPEEIQKALLDRGLPTQIFGYDAPVLDHQPRTEHGGITNDGAVSAED
jgi:hypothetical protein